MNKLKKHFGCYKFFQREIFAAIGVFFYVRVVPKML